MLSLTIGAGCRAAARTAGLDVDAFDFVEGDRVGTTIVSPGGLRVDMPGDTLCMFELRARVWPSFFRMITSFIIHTRILLGGFDGEEEKSLRR